MSAGSRDSAATHVRAEIDSLLRTLLARDPGTRSGTDPEDLHQMRVATRRMRSVLKQSGDLLGPDAESVRAELGWLAAALGEVRDHDVLLIRLRELVNDFDTRDQQAGRALIAVFIADRTTARRRLTRTMATARYSELLRAAAGLVVHEPSADIPSEHEADAGPADRTALIGKARKTYRKLIKAVAALPAEPPDEDLHALRIHCKKLRYTADLASGAAKKKRAKKLRAVVKATKKLQTILGDHQDAVIAADRMRALVDTQEPPVAFLAGRIAERELRRRTEARDSWPAAALRVDDAAATAF